MVAKIQVEAWLRHRWILGQAVLLLLLQLLPHHDQYASMGQEKLLLWVSFLYQRRYRAGRSRNLFLLSIVKHKCCALALLFILFQ